MRTFLLSLILLTACIADNSPPPASTESAIKVNTGRCTDNMLALWDQPDFRGTLLCLSGSGRFTFSGGWAGTRSFRTGTCPGRFDGVLPYFFSQQEIRSSVPLTVTNATSVNVTAEPDAAFCP